MIEKMTDLRMVIGKVIGIAIVLLYINSLFIIIVPEVFTYIMTIIPILLLSVVVSVDIAIRPVSTKPEQSNQALVAVAFLSLPLMVSLPYFEYIYLTGRFLATAVGIMFTGGVLLLLLGAAVLITSRVQIGHCGGPRITIEDDHSLVTTGMYRYIRNPQYLGFLLLLFGYSFSFGSILVALLIVVGLFG
ncbi:MAG: methyltransferase, partial [Candidatus Thorarchaeota archaeon]